LTLGRALAKIELMKKIFLLFMVLILASCASYFKRKECAATNWFDYGEKIALDGRRVTGDPFVTECVKAEGEIDDVALDRGFKTGLEKYCQPDTVFQIGKNGSFFSTEMCEGGSLTALKSRHRAGVLAYCQKANGYSVGAKGTPYNKICPVDLEAAFLPEFNRGRKKYLNAEYSENEKQISQLDREANQLQIDLKRKTQEYQSLQVLRRDDQNSAQMLNNASAQMHSLQYSLTEKQNAATSLRDKNRAIKIELVQLDN
jgi:hypothetical protein